MGEMKLKLFMSPSAGQRNAAKSRLLLTNTLSQLSTLPESCFLFAHRSFNLDAKELSSRCSLLDISFPLPIFIMKINANFGTYVSE